MFNAYLLVIIGEGALKLQIQAFYPPGFFHEYYYFIIIPGCPSFWFKDDLLCLF